MLSVARVEQLLEQRAPLYERNLAQVVPIEVWQVEQKVVDVLGARRIEGVLQRVEPGLAVAVEHDDLAVEPSRGDAHALDRLGQRLHLRRPVVAMAREELDLAVVDAREQAVAVELDLVAPATTGRQALDGDRKLRRERGGQRCFDGLGQVGRRQGRCSRQARGADRDSARLAQLDGPERLVDHAIGQRGDHVVVGQRPRPGVTLLEQDPRILLVAGLGDAHQLPEAGELFAVQLEQQLALGHAVARVADRLPVAAVPDDHRAGAVLARRDRAFEAAVGHGMVFDMDRHALLGRIEAWALGHRPAQQDAVELEAKVVVKARGPMFLDDKGELR